MSVQRVSQGPARGASPGIGRAGKTIVSVRSWVAVWWARPLTSLHLLLAVFALLTGLGLVMVLSASSVESFTQDGSSYRVFSRQAIYCAVGLVWFWVGLRISPRRLRALAPGLLLVTLVLLVAVLIPGLGTSVGGARKWFVVAGLSFQPAEPAKVTLAVWGAHILAARRPVGHRWRYWLSPLVPVAALTLTLVVLQPDLGTAILIGVVVIAVLFFAAAPRGLMVALAGGGLVGAVILGLTAGYRHSRITSFLSPATADPLGAAYQSTQALYSLADGGLFGVGLGQGRAKWSYLPNAHNDFIFAIIGEELGLVGAFAVLALFAALAVTGLRIAARNTDPWIRILTATLTTWLVTQAAINIGYVVGLLPVTGIPLPLISAGGTSLVLTMFVFGILANAARHEPDAATALRHPGPGPLDRLLHLRPPQPTKRSPHDPRRKSS